MIPEIKPSRLSIFPCDHWQRVPDSNEKCFTECKRCSCFWLGRHSFRSGRYERVICELTSYKAIWFPTSDYCRLLPYISEQTMPSAWDSLMLPRTGQEIYIDYQDPWTDQIALLFNDEIFNPKIDTLADGVTLSDNSDIDPAAVLCHREGGIFKI